MPQANRNAIHRDVPPEALRIARDAEAAGVTANCLCRAAGVHHRTITRWLTAGTAPAPETLARLETALDHLTR